MVLKIVSTLFNMLAKCKSVSPATDVEVNAIFFNVKVIKKTVFGCCNTFKWEPEVLWVPHKLFMYNLIRLHENPAKQSLIVNKNLYKKVTKSWIKVKIWKTFPYACTKLSPLFFRIDIHIIIDIPVYKRRLFFVDKS